MKVIVLSTKDIKVNFAKNRKKMLYIFLVFLILGVLAGVCYGYGYMQDQYTLDDTTVDFVDFHSIEQKEDYYYSALNELKEKKLSLDSYIQYFGQVDMSAESTMKIKEFQKELSTFSNLYNETWNFWWNSSSVDYDTEQKRNSFFETRIEECESKINAANQMITEAHNNSFTRPFVKVTESTALDSILSAKNEQKVWEKKKKLVDDSDIVKIEEDNVHLEKLLKNSSDELNELVTVFNEIVKYMEEKEQYDIVYNKYLMKQYIAAVGMSDELPLEQVMANSKNNAIVYARSISGLDSTKERFFAMLTFFSLFGIAVSILWGGGYFQSAEINLYNIVNIFETANENCIRLPFLNQGILFCKRFIHLNINNFMWVGKGV